ncbi:MAG: DNA-methyltransferase [Rhodoferax sp.]
MTTETIADSAQPARATGIKDMQSEQIAKATLYLGDCLQVLRAMPDNSVDSVVTDPPYGLYFMGKKWDYDVPDVAVWVEVLRVLKPGGHLLSFAGTRTQHRMACRIEDAGFEIRDMIAWVYGSGFPKSLDLSKAIDKAAGAVREVVDRRVNSVGFDTTRQGGGGWTSGKVDITTPATPAAQQWQGWGTALKPALEPITMARKPFACTVADNVLQHGTGALNIDASRIASQGEENPSIARRISAGVSGKCGMDMASNQRTKEGASTYNRDTDRYVNGHPNESLGRWPANLIHDGSAEVAAVFPLTAPGTSSMRGEKTSNNTHDGWARESHKGFDSIRGHTDNAGSAARFFYNAKTSSDDRNEGLEMFRKIDSGCYAQDDFSKKNMGMRTLKQNHHPTVKPTDLMHYLIRLVTPPGGIALDPYMGSGSTGKAAALGDFRFIGIERDPSYFAIACARLKHASAQGHLFGA